MHPSVAEGFEKLLTFGICFKWNTLSFFRTSTAVDQHFEVGSLPNNFWCGLDNGYSAIWAKQIEKILLDKKILNFIKIK